eukprot:6196671-Pleurochrysis_carterae.AAC.5
MQLSSLAVHWHSIRQSGIYKYTRGSDTVGAGAERNEKPPCAQAPTVKNVSLNRKRHICSRAHRHTSALCDKASVPECTSLYTVQHCRGGCDRGCTHVRADVSSMGGNARVGRYFGTD